MELAKHILSLNERLSKKHKKYGLNITELRQFQIDVIETALRCEQAEGKRDRPEFEILSPIQVIDAPVGYGKTLIACAIMRLGKVMFGLHSTIARVENHGNITSSIRKRIVVSTDFENLVVCSPGTIDAWEKHLKLVGIVPEVIAVPSDLAKLASTDASTVLITNKALAKATQLKRGIFYRLFFDEPDTQNVSGCGMFAGTFYMISATIDSVLNVQQRMQKKHLIFQLFNGIDPRHLSICGPDAAPVHKRVRIDVRHECFDRFGEILEQLELSDDVRRMIRGGLTDRAIKALYPDCSENETLQGKRSLVNAIRAHLVRRRDACIGNVSGTNTPGYKRYTTILEKFEDFFRGRRCESCGYSEVNALCYCGAKICSGCNKNQTACRHKHEFIATGIYEKMKKVSDMASVDVVKEIFKYCSVFEAPYTASEKNGVIVEGMQKPLEKMKRKGLVFEYFDGAELASTLREEKINFKIFGGRVTSKMKTLRQLEIGEIDLIVFTSKEDMAGLHVPFATDVFVSDSMDQNHREQCIGRALRYGCDHPVTVHTINQIAGQ